MPIYILKHPSSDFAGFRGGVDFHRGRGSTSSMKDALDLSRDMGCELSVIGVDEKERSAQVLEKKNEGGTVELSLKILEPEKKETEEGGAVSPPASSPPVESPRENKGPKRGRPRK